MRRYLIAACAWLCLLPAVYAQAPPAQPEPKLQATVQERTPDAKTVLPTPQRPAAPARQRGESPGSAQAGDAVPGIQEMLPDAGFWDGMKDMMGEILWTAKMALIGIVVILALAVLGKIFAFMHK